MKKRIFKTLYWGDDQSTEVVFEAINHLPPQELITACMVLAVHGKDRIVLSKPARGWGLPGGHREEGETAEECLLREAMEEAAMTLENLELIGRWSTKKRFHSPHNAKYPDQGYQLLYVANVKELNEFTPQLEITERTIVPIVELKDYHHDTDNFMPILNYVIEAGYLKLERV
jgi:8-oxo-dGTP pyrophosphatase MutT (NUDIX family)